MFTIKTRLLPCGDGVSRGRHSAVSVIPSRRRVHLATVTPHTRANGATQGDVMLEGGTGFPLLTCSEVIGDFVCFHSTKNTSIWAWHSHAVGASAQGDSVDRARKFTRGPHGIVDSMGMAGYYRPNANAEIRL